MLIAKGRSKDIATKVVTEAINIGNNGIFKKYYLKEEKLGPKSNHFNANFG
mgnify:CR=1 FL=1